MVTVLKTVVGASRPWVRIPPPPPACAEATAGKPDCLCGTYIYLESNKDNNLYIGSSDIVNRRLSEHNS